MDLHALLWLISLIHNRSHLCSIHTSQKISRFLKKSFDSFFPFLLLFYYCTIVGASRRDRKQRSNSFLCLSIFSPPSKIKFDEFEQFRNSWEAKRFFATNYKCIVADDRRQKRETMSEKIIKTIYVPLIIKLIDMRIKIKHRPHL